MIDIINQIEAIERDFSRREGADGDEVAVLIRRSYDAPNADVWDALTDPERVKRWFYPVSGDLRAGGTFQLEGNAGGEIVQFEPPRLLRLTFGGPTSLVELRLSPSGEDGTVLELEHTVPIDIAISGAGSLYTGPGWDGAFVSLDLYLHGVVADDPMAAANSPEGLELSRQSVHAWIAAVEASGTATADEITAAAEMSFATFAPGLGGETSG